MTMRPFTAVGCFALALLMSSALIAQSGLRTEWTPEDPTNELPPPVVYTQEEIPDPAEERARPPLGLGAMGGMGMGGPGGPGKPGFSAVGYFARPTTGLPQGEELALVRYQLAIGAPIYRNEGDMVLLSAGVRNSSFITDALLPDSQRAFPNELWNITTGLTYIHQWDNGWTSGVGVNVGSASDRPFHSLREVNLGMNLFLRTPGWNERDSWLFALIYAPTGNLTFPIPGVAYLWNPSDNLRVSIGLPFSVMWKPVEKLTLNLMYIPVTNVTARATYDLFPSVQVFGGFEWFQEAFFLADRVERRERFIGFEKRLVGGVTWTLGKYGAVEVNSGYAFDRYYGRGENQIGSLADEVDIASGAFLGASYRLVF